MLYQKHTALAASIERNSLILTARHRERINETWILVCTSCWTGHMFCYAPTFISDKYTNTTTTLEPHIDSFDTQDDREYHYLKHRGQLLNYSRGGLRG